MLWVKDKLEITARATYFTLYSLQCTKQQAFPLVPQGQCAYEDVRWKKNPSIHSSFQDLTSSEQWEESEPGRALSHPQF